MKQFDVVILGAGGAGLMCAIEAGKRGRKVALIDHSDKVGAKIRISGGGRCNFTNLTAGPENYLSKNPHFCRSALSRYTPADFIQKVKEHRIPFHEKKFGQLFCDHSAEDIIRMFTGDCEKFGVETHLNTKIESIQRTGVYNVWTNQDLFTCHSLVVATGGLSIPKVGASDLGYRIAKDFGLNVVETAPALDGFKFSSRDLEKFMELAGVSSEVILKCGNVSFRENILFTHVGLSGPAALQASLYWEKGKPIHLNLFPDEPKDGLFGWFLAQKKSGDRSEIKTLLARFLPKRLADRLSDLELPPHASLHSIAENNLEDFCNKLVDLTLIPESTVGYNKAEVTKGGVDTKELSSQTMEARKAKGLYFIGEVVDVTGWLGGYNFQWAWSSGWAAGQVV